MKRPAWAKPPASVVLEAPATVANLGPGFDVLGLALEGPVDRVRARRRAEPGVGLVLAGRGGKSLPGAPAANTAGIAAAAALRALAGRGIRDAGVELTLEKGIPLASGMGSSAASAAAGAGAVAALWPGCVDRDELLGAVLEAEAAVSGRHADNAAAAVLGGLVIVESVEPLRVRRVEPALLPCLVLVKPAFGLETARARAALPAAVPLRDAVHNLAALAVVMDALAKGDLAGFAGALRDRLAEPYRTGLIAGFDEARAAALRAGALAVSISGAGPTLFAVVEDEARGARVGRAMGRAWRALGHGSRAYVTRASLAGIRHVEIRP